MTSDQDKEKQQVLHSLWWLQFLFQELKDLTEPQRRQVIQRILERHQLSGKEQEKLRNYLLAQQLNVAEPIATGAFGAVYKKGTDAFKVLERLDMEAERHILQEIVLGSKISHPLIIPITNVFQWHDAIALEMPFLQGSAYFQQLSPRDLVVYMGQIVCAVQALHQIGFLHLDIKPDNILVDTRTHSIRLADLGSALPLGITKIGLFGTSGYLQSFSDGVKPTEGTDAYALVVTLFQLLAENILQENLVVQSVPRKDRFQNFVTQEGKIVTLTRLLHRLRHESLRFLVTQFVELLSQHQSISLGKIYDLLQKALLMENDSGSLVCPEAPLVDPKLQQVVTTFADMKQPTRREYIELLSRDFSTNANPIVAQLAQDSLTAGWPQEESLWPLHSNSP